MNKESCSSFIAGEKCKGYKISELCSRCPCFDDKGKLPKDLADYNSKIDNCKKLAFSSKLITNPAPSAMSVQVGGDHYKSLGMQPLELTLINMGYEAFKGACYTKINKYIIRKKDNEVEQLKKARHVLDMWIEEAEKRSS